MNRVYYQGVTFALLKNGSPVAQLVQNKEKTCSGRDLTAILNTVRLSDSEAKEWRVDLQDSRKTLKGSKDKWK